MAWVAVDSLNRELIFRNEPFRDIDTDYMVTYHGWFDRNMNSWGVELPKGSIKKLIGRDLTWSDELVELKEEDILFIRILLALLMIITM